MVKILWVDDEVELLKPHVLFLQQKGYEVDTCNNGYDAIDMASEGAYDLIILDEPTNHLDVDAKDELKRALIAYRGSILMVCHEPEFYDGLADTVWDASKWTTRTV